MTVSRPPVLDMAAWGLLAALSLVWGGSFFFAEVALAALPPFTIVLARLALGAAGLWLLVCLTRATLPIGLRDWRDLAAMGLLNNALPFSLIVWGQQWIDGGLASVLNATTPVFGVVAAHFLTRDEKLTANRLAGVAIGVAGVAVLVGPAAPDDSGGYITGSAAVLAAAVSYAAAGLWGRRLRHLPPVSAAAGQVGCSTLIVLPLALLLERPWTLPAPPPEVWGALAGIGLLSTSLAYLLFFAILRRAGGSNVMLVTLMIPPSAVLLGVMFLGEEVGPGQLVGMALIAAALLAIDGRLPRALCRRWQSV
ncbi:MAG: DMT family transporter [Alphaproteobacteria bacterium]|nr:DMT family transporter [Alphaproteobacteria bacterium]